MEKNFKFPPPPPPPPKTVLVSQDVSANVGQRHSYKNRGANGRPKPRGRGDGFRGRGRGRFASTTQKPEHGQDAIDSQSKNSNDQHGLQSLTESHDVAKKRSVGYNPYSSAQTSSAQRLSFNHAYDGRGHHVDEIGDVQDVDADEHDESYDENGYNNDHDYHDRTPHQSTVQNNPHPHLSFHNAMPQHPQYHGAPALGYYDQNHPMQGPAYQYHLAQYSSSQHPHNHLQWSQYPAAQNGSLPYPPHLNSAPHFPPFQYPPPQGVFHQNLPLYQSSTQNTMPQVHTYQNPSFPYATAQDPSMQIHSSQNPTERNPFPPVYSKEGDLNPTLLRHDDPSQSASIQNAIYQAPIYQDSQHHVENPVRNYERTIRQYSDGEDRGHAMPAIPNFNAQHVSSETHVSKLNQPKQKGKRKRKTNQLGLTPHGDEYEDSEEDIEVDEEAVAGSQLDAGALRIEYKGRFLVLKDESDIEQWLAERKKKWPSAARKEERRIELEKRKAEEKLAREKKGNQQATLNEAQLLRRQKILAKTEEVNKEKQLRLDEDQKIKAEEIAAQLRIDQAKTQAPIDQTMKQATPNKKDKKMQKMIDKHLAKAAKLKAKMQRVQAKDVTRDVSQKEIAEPEVGKQRVKAKELRLHTNQQMNELKSDLQNKSSSTAEDGKSETGFDVRASSSSDLSESSSLVSSFESSSSSEASESTSSDDEPDETSIRRTEPIIVPPPPRQKPATTVCRVFKKTGYCKFGKKCRFIHDAKGAKNKNKTTADQTKKPKRLHALMMEQQLRKEQREIKDEMEE